MHELDITEKALSCCLADKAMEHYARVTPWGARSRCSADYRYTVRVSFGGHCHLWMYESTRERVPLMYFVFNRKIGALTTNGSHEALITMLNEDQIFCMEEAHQELLTASMLTDLSM